MERGESATCRVIRPSGSYDGKQGLPLFRGDRAETVGSTGICMHLLTIPPGVRAKAHLHESHETAIYVLSGEAHTWYGERLEHARRRQAGELFYIPAGVPHLPANLSGIALLARSIAAHRSERAGERRAAAGAGRAGAGFVRSPGRPADVAVVSSPSHQTPLAGMPLRSTLRGAVRSFQVDSALVTAGNGSRATNLPWPSRVLTVASSIATSPRGQRVARQAGDLVALEDVVVDGRLLASWP